MRFDMKAIGMRVKVVRIRAARTTLGLAHDTGITQAELCQIESGDVDPRLSTVLALADVLCVPVAWLVTGEER